MPWISVRNWRKFQHYDPNKRAPIWIKNYTDLLDDEDYLRLTARQRSILHGIWLLYAASRCKLGSSPALLGQRLGDESVRTRDIESLVHAGWIDIVASKTLAEGYQHASPEVEREVEREAKAVTSIHTPETNGPGLHDIQELQAQTTASIRSL